MKEILACFTHYQKVNILIGSSKFSDSSPFNPSADSFTCNLAI